MQVDVGPDDLLARSCQRHWTPAPVPEPKRRHVPYLNAFAGRDTAKKKAGLLQGGELGSRQHQHDYHWNLRVDGQPTDVVALVEMMIETSWEEVKTKIIREDKMRDIKIEELQLGGVPLRLDVRDTRENDTSESMQARGFETKDPDTGDPYYSQPQRFTIMSIEDLQQWHRAGRPVQPTSGKWDPRKPGIEDSQNAGSAALHQHRNLKHPQDPIGLVADKLGRAIANQRCDPDSGKVLEPVFVNVYSLGHASVMKMMDKGAKLITGSGAFHAGVEAFGAEWSYGGNDGTESGLFIAPPKFCDMHEYEQTHYVGDTTMSFEEFERWLQLLHREDFKQEDPVDPAFRKIVAQKGAPQLGQVPDEYFDVFSVPGSVNGKHPHYTDQPMPITKDSDIGHSYTASDQVMHRRPWTTFEDADTGKKVVMRMGWWGDEYELLRNNCCWCSDYLIKLLVGTYGVGDRRENAALPNFIFSAAKFGSGVEQMGKMIGEGVSRAFQSLVHLFDAPEAGGKAGRKKRGCTASVV
eukprot:COSAG01_NODE_1567_length_9877_cov_8.690939_8_plen_522_part_00